MPRKKDAIAAVWSSFVFRFGRARARSALLRAQAGRSQRWASRRRGRCPAPGPCRQGRGSWSTHRLGEFERERFSGTRPSLRTRSIPRRMRRRSERLRHRLRTAPTSESGIGGAGTPVGSITRRSSRGFSSGSTTHDGAEIIKQLNPDGGLPSYRVIWTDSSVSTISAPPGVSWQLFPENRIATLRSWASGAASDHPITSDLSAISPTVLVVWRCSSQPPKLSATRHAGIQRRNLHRLKPTTTPLDPLAPPMIALLRENLHAQFLLHVM